MRSCFHDAKLVMSPKLTMSKIFTPITQQTNGYRVVIVQEANEDGTHGAFVGCLLQTPDSPDNDRMMLLGDAFKEFKARTAKVAAVPLKVELVPS
jgi:hypothetical protein